MPKNEQRGLIWNFKAVGDKVLKDIAKNMKSVSKSTDKVRRDMSGLRSVFLSAFAGIGVKGITDIADSMQLITDRINIFTGSAEETEKTLILLTDAANQTKASISSIGEVYNRVALSTNELGLSTEQLVGFTTTLQNTFRLSGSSAAEATGATIQLTQGLASGALRGQELRSVLEANALLGEILADKFNKSRGELIKFAESGALSAKAVLEALASSALDINERAEKLGQTFSQSLTVALNKVAVNIGILNKEYRVNIKFAKIMDVAVSKLDTALLALATTTLPLVITRVGQLLLSFKTLSRGTKLTLLLSGIVAIGNELLKTKRTLDDFSINELNKELDITRKSMSGVSAEFNKNTLAIKSNEKGLLGTFSLRKKNESLQQSFINQSKREGRILDLLAKKRSEASKDTGVPTLKEAILAFSSGQFKFVEKGIVTLKSLNAAFSKKEDLEAYAKGLKFLKEQEIAGNIKKGSINIFEARKQLESFNKEIDELLSKDLSPFEKGVKKYLNSIGTFSEEVTNAIENSFSTLEDQLFDFVKTGKFLFNDFAQAVLDDLTRIGIRKGIQGAFDKFSFGGADSVSKEAKGGVYAGGVRQKFAKGGVVNEPTYFPTRSGTGLMGESGRAEAVLPLKRVSGGDLGVKALPSNTIVNINNQAGAEIDVEETTDGNVRTLDITITKTVRNAIAKGQLDKVLGSSFGISRKGSR